MFSSHSTIGNALVDFGARLGHALALFAMQVFVWLGELCQLLIGSFAVTIFASIIVGILYWAGSQISNSRFVAIPNRAMPIQALDMDKSMPNETSEEPDRFPMPDKFPMSEDLLPAEDRLFIQVQDVVDGLKCAFLYSIKTKHDRPFLRSYCSNQTIANVSLMKDFSLMTKGELDGRCVEAPLRLWFRIRVYEGPEIRVALTAVRTEPGWKVCAQQVYNTSEWPSWRLRGTLPSTTTDSHVYLFRKTNMEMRLTLYNILSCEK